MFSELMSFGFPPTEWALDAYLKLLARASVEFTAPVRIGDTVTTTTEIADIVVDKRRLKIRCIARGGDGTVVMRGESTVKQLREVDAPPG